MYSYIHRLLYYSNDHHRCDEAPSQKCVPKSKTESLFILAFNYITFAHINNSLFHNLHESFKFFDLVDVWSFVSGIK